MIVVKAVNMRPFERSLLTAEITTRFSRNPPAWLGCSDECVVQALDIREQLDCFADTNRLASCQTDLVKDVPCHVVCQWRPDRCAYCEVSDGHCGTTAIPSNRGGTARDA